MTDGEALYLIGVIALFVVFSAVLAYSQITSGGRRLREGPAWRIYPACPHKSAWWGRPYMRSMLIELMPAARSASAAHFVTPRG